MKLSPKQKRSNLKKGIFTFLVVILVLWFGAAIQKVHGWDGWQVNGDPSFINLTMPCTEYAELVAAFAAADLDTAHRAILAARGNYEKYFYSRAWQYVKQNELEGLPDKARLEIYKECGIVKTL